MRTITLRESEIHFTTSRSGGPGGQNVNKVETRVTAAFDIASSRIFTPAEKDRLYRHELIRRRLDSSGSLVISSQEHRMQAMNRASVIKKLEELLTKALQPVKKRVPTKPSKAAERRRRVEKQLHSERKRSRRTQGDI